jgi:hypothetical protein
MATDMAAEARARAATIGRTEALTRLGFAARGLIYILIGFLALQAGRAEDPAGIIEYLGSGAGRLLLGLIALGLLAYGLWRLSEAVVDSEGHGNDARGVAIRIGGAASGVIHLGLGFYAAKLAINGGRGSAGDGAEEGAATALALPGGWMLLTLAAAALALTGAYQLVKAAKGDFLGHLDPEAARRAWVKWIGRAGYAARGIVFLVMAWSLWRAGQETRAEQAAGMDQALAALPPNVELIVAAGLLLFGLFSLVEARYRRINDPHVLARLERRAAQAARH